MFINSVMPPRICAPGLRMAALANSIVVAEAVARVLVLAGGTESQLSDQHAPSHDNRRAQLLLEPVNVIRFIFAGDVDGLVNRVGAVGINHQFDVRADGFPRDAYPLHIFADGCTADLDFDRFGTRGDIFAHFFRQGV